MAFAVRKICQRSNRVSSIGTLINNFTEIRSSRSRSHKPRFTWNENIYFHSFYYNFFFFCLSARKAVSSSLKHRTRHRGCLYFYHFLFFFPPFFVRYFSRVVKSHRRFGRQILCGSWWAGPAVCLRLKPASPLNEQAIRAIVLRDERTRGPPVRREGFNECSRKKEIELAPPNEINVKSFISLEWKPTAVQSESDF